MQYMRNYEEKASIKVSCSHGKSSRSSALWSDRSENGRISLTVTGYFCNILESERWIAFLVVHSGHFVLSNNYIY